LRGPKLVREKSVGIKKAIEKKRRKQKVRAGGMEHE